MWNPFKQWADYRLKRLEMELAAQVKPYEAILAAVDSQNQFLKNWLEGFRVTEIPASSTKRDEDSWVEEQAKDGTLWQPLDPATLFANLTEDQ